MLPLNPEEEKKGAETYPNQNNNIIYSGLPIQPKAFKAIVAI